jgi:hypothetical protein
MTLAALLLALAVEAPVPTPAEAAPAEAAPAEAAPVEAGAVDAAPVETAPVQAAPVEASSVDAAPAEADAPSAEASPPSPVPFAIAGMSAAMSLGTGVAAAFISMSIERSLEEAAAGTTPLDGYYARSAGFFVCAGLSAASGLVAVGALGAGLLFE